MHSHLLELTDKHAKCKVIKNLGSYPHHLLAPILQTLVDKAEALFSGQQVVHDEKPSISSVDELHHLGFFPQRIVLVTQ